MKPATEPCKTCGGHDNEPGSGRVPRERRKMANGEPDPFDRRDLELCPSCSGAGVVPITGPRRIPESVVPSS